MKIWGPYSTEKWMRNVSLNFPSQYGVLKLGEHFDDKLNLINTSDINYDDYDVGVYIKRY